MIESEIIKQCRRGDKTAFKAIYDTHHQGMLRVALRMLGNQQDAEDAVQSAFVKLYRGIGRFRFQSKFSTYFYRILSRVCFDMIRSRKRRQTDELQETFKIVQPQVDLKMQLEEAIAQLPERMRLCFMLFAIEELKQEDIADIMELSIGGVKSTIYQAKVRLRRILKDGTKE